MILDYLKRNPGAGDTLEGIARWWLAQARIEVSVEQVRKALEELIDRGVIKTELLKDGSILFKACERNYRGLS